ncbi:MAG: hypothetical protein HC930_04575 [Hydrococcus sp. SU_1_0]|nr:hypothetical protein [Hydrococcus sp. SU_1_0]
MGQEEFSSPPSEPDKSEMQMEEVPSEIEDIDQLATRPPQKVKPYQENFIEEKLSKARIAESQESTRGRLAMTIVSIYGSTILFCFIVIGFGMAKGERKEILTLIITSQATLIGSAIGFYFGKNQ